MKQYRTVVVILLVLVALFGCQRVTDSLDTSVQLQETLLPSGTPIPGKYIVVLENQKNPNGGFGVSAQVINQVLTDYNIASSRIEHRYSHAILGFAGELTDQELTALRNDPRVKYIEQDKVITLGPTINVGPPGSGSNPEQVPWGITRVGGPIDGTGKTAWIIDTGVDLDHPDLNVDVSRSVTFVTRGQDAKSADDLNGHGTHVAGTIAAIDNDIDVVGVAAGATVVAVKVLDRRGSGSYSAVINGVDYVAANAAPGDAANMSLGGPPSTALDDAVRNAASKGIYFAIAAGNDGDDANNYSPARVNGTTIFTVSAIDDADTFASFSNWGNPPVDYAAPGVSILSLWKDGGTNTISGTSMATPHVCGLLLLGSIQADGYAIGDPDGNPDPIAHY